MYSNKPKVILVQTCEWMIHKVLHTGIYNVMKWNTCSCEMITTIRSVNTWIILYNWCFILLHYFCVVLEIGHYADTHTPMYARMHIHMHADMRTTVYAQRNKLGKILIQIKIDKACSIYGLFSYPPSPKDHFNPQNLVQCFIKWWKF